MPPTHETEAFCLALKAARKRRGLTLESIAEATKVCVSYYAALEANNLKRWPKGLFRRSFFRGYIEAVGLPVAETMEEFVRLFPEDDRADAAPASPAVAAAPEAPCRLALDQSWHGTKPPIGERLVNAAADAGIIAIVAAAIALLTRFDLAMAVAMTSAGYFTLATLLFGETPSAWARRWLPEIAIGVMRDTEPQAGDPETPEERVWVSDARRVRPRDAAARLRVRFKTQ